MVRTNQRASAHETTRGAGAADIAASMVHTEDVHL